MERGQAEKRERLGKYELLELLGKGGMGEVWKARDIQLQRHVAIKLLRTDLEDNPDFASYFMREARLVAALRHANIVQIHDFQVAGTQGSTQAYMVMDYIEGGTLAEAIRGMVRKRVFWSASEIVDLFAAISLALDYAHAQGMIHRDIKPANILLDQTLATGHVLGEPVLTDFGIARWQSGDSTVKGFVGTPLYISPEQALSRPIDTRSDLYSLGIILYEVLTGVTPFRGDNPLSIMLQHIDEPPPSPALINPLISPALAAVVLQSIAKNPQDRFPSSTEMTIALAQAFHIPVPTRLDASKEQQKMPIYNPLQPRPGAAPVPPTSTSPAPPLRFAPVGVHNPESRSPFPSPANGIIPTSPSANISATPQSAGEGRSFGATVPQLSSQPIIRRRTGVLSQKWLLVVSVACVLLLLLGLGATGVISHLFPASSASTPVASSGIAGQLLFLSNSSAPKGTFNELQIDLTRVPTPPAGQVYYAWLTQANSESETVSHWPLQVDSNGTIHDLYTSSSPQTNLFIVSNRLLITAEASSVQPDVPTFVLTQHFYYASITHTSTISPTFAIKNCPTNNVNSATNPCR